MIPLDECTLYLYISHDSDDLDFDEACLNDFPVWVV